MAQLVVHHLNNSRSQRLLWLLEELALPYEIQRYARDAKTQLAPASLKAVHPLGKSPLLEHDDKVLAETAAIVEYVLDNLGEGRLQPAAGTDEALRYRYFLHYAEGSLMPPLLIKLIIGQLRGDKIPWLIRPIAKGLADGVDKAFTDEQIATHLGFVNDELAGREWFAGELSGADIMMSFPLEAASMRVNMTRYPHIAAFVKRVHERPAYQRALERGGEYAYA